MAEPKDIAGYRVLAKIGTGAASDLFAVQDKSKQVWALKYVEKKNDKDHRFIEQIEHEYEVGSHLDHPHIRRVYKIIRHRKMLKVFAVSLIMELIDAHTLDSDLPSTKIDAVRVFQQVAEGLAHMHSRGYVHADIKPNNVMITDQGQVKIIDLGQGCKIGTVKPRIQGTPGYMAPEQAHRQAITPATDIYNFGAMMYWVLLQEVIPTAMPPKDATGNSIYSGAVDADMLQLPDPPHERDRDIHPLLSKQIMDCIQISPNDRSPSMEKVAARLELIGDLLENPPSAETDHQFSDDDTQF